MGKRPILKPASDRIDNFCNDGLLECENQNKINFKKNKTEKIKITKKKKYQPSENHAIYPSSWAPFLEILKGEIWDVPILVAAGFLACILIIFEISLLARTFRHKYASSRRHLFLGQVKVFHVSFSFLVLLFWTFLVRFSGPPTPI